MNAAIIRKALFVIRGVHEVIAHPVADDSQVHSVIAFTDRGISIEAHISKQEDLSELVEFVENHCLGFAHNKKYEISIKVVD